MSLILIRLASCFFVWNKHYIYLHPLGYVFKLVLKFNGIEFVCVWSYTVTIKRMLVKRETVHKSKSIYFLLNPFCIKAVTIHLNARNFAVMYVYNKIKFKPRYHNLTT